jgi:hypothetical protein
MSDVPEFIDLNQVLAHLKKLRSRGEIKRWGKWLENSIWYEEVQTFLSSTMNIDIDTSENQNQVSGKKCIRIFLDRSQSAQIRKNPIHRDESFLCSICKRSVDKGKVQIRDHCPYCLHGIHLDIIPGDRASDCKGVLVPQSLETTNAQTWITYVCKTCNYIFRVRSHPDDDILSFLSTLSKFPNK